MTTKQNLHTEALSLLTFIIHFTNVLEKMQFF